MRNTGTACFRHACSLHSFLPTRTYPPYSLSFWGYLNGGSLLSAGNMPPIAATSTQQCCGWAIRPWKLLPVRRLEDAECNVSLVIPSIVDGLLSSCCESDCLVAAVDSPGKTWLWGCWRQLQSEAHRATMKAVVHTIHLAHRTRPQHAVGQHYGVLWSVCA